MGQQGDGCGTEDRIDVAAAGLVEGPGGGRGQARGPQPEWSDRSDVDPRRINTAGAVRACTTEGEVMAKFKIGDRIYSDKIHVGRRLYGVVSYTVGKNTVSAAWDHGGGWIGDETWFELAEPATPTEHPALTLAKAEVVRLMSQEVFETLGGYSHGRLGAMQEVLSAFGLRYSPKPVVPQPVEYEFVSIEPLRQES